MSNDFESEDGSKPVRIKNDALVIETNSTTEVYDSKYLVAALLVYVARGDENISSEETEEMLRLISNHFQLPSAQSLELLTKALSDIVENPDFESLLGELSGLLSIDEKEEITVMMLKIVAADGRRDVEELSKFQQAAAIIGVSGDCLHRAYDRYFSETIA